MHIEFERKFLVNLAELARLKEHATEEIPIKQYYICADDNAVVRLRCAYNAIWFLTIKHNAGEPGKNFESECRVPDEFAESLAKKAARRILKTRFEVPYHGFNLEVDVFQGGNAGLVLAEVEFKSDEQSAEFTKVKPVWLTEVTGDPAYSNYALSKNV